MTETGMILGNPYNGERRPGSVGLPFEGVEVKVTTADGEETQTGVGYGDERGSKYGRLAGRGGGCRRMACSCMGGMLSGHVWLENQVI
jgi:hypothetical protein